MHYNAFVRFAALVLGGLLTATMCASAAQFFETNSVERTTEPMSYTTWAAQRALDIHEDDARWDGRINGNMTQGEWTYQLNCPTLDPEVMCTLEGERLK